MLYPLFSPLLYVAEEVGCMTVDPSHGKTVDMWRKAHIQLLPRHSLLLPLGGSSDFFCDPSPLFGVPHFPRIPPTLHITQTNAQKHRYSKSTTSASGSPSSFGPPHTPSSSSPYSSPSSEAAATSTLRAKAVSSKTYVGGSTPRFWATTSTIAMTRCLAFLEKGCGSGPASANAFQLYNRRIARIARKKRTECMTSGWPRRGLCMRR
jgi:hypothetical protein